jgi:hypothetical protein
MYIKTTGMMNLKKLVTDVQNKTCDGSTVTGISHRMSRNKNRQIFGAVELNILQSTVVIFCYMELKRGD